MADESIVATPSVEETPSEPVTEALVEQPVEPTEPEEKLYDLPDGRQVDGETLAKEWKENFLPEFTRKSQALAEVERAKADINNQPKEDPYSNPEYVPQNYAEIIKVAEERALQAWEMKQQEVADRNQAIETKVTEQLESIRKTDPSLDENALFLHANKYGFTDLPTAYQNMKDMANLAKTVQQTTAKNIAKRSDPVSTTNNQPTGNSVNPSSFRSARDYLQAIKGQ